MTDMRQHPQSGLAIDARDLRKAFGDVLAVGGFSLQVEAGEIVGLVGPDGAGKTTTMRLLCGILALDAGSARVAGQDVSAAPEAVKARIGYLPQRFSLHRDLTVDENIRYVADLYEVPAGTWEQRRDELLEITYMSRFRKRLAGRLSGGMRQKLALICTLIHRPEVVFLDEPTTGVDPVSRRDFWQILHDLPRQGVTILVSTPYMDEAARCHRVAFMHHGRILAADTPKGLVATVQGSILEVRCSPQRTAREALKQDPRIESVEVFGDRLHVVLRPGADASAVGEAVAPSGAALQSVEPASPSLEDAFLALLAAGDAGDRTG